MSEYHLVTGSLSAQSLLPERDAKGHKGTFGKVLMVCGSKYMAGAAVLSTKAAYRIGAGMVRTVTPACNREILSMAVPEALLSEAEQEDEAWENDLEWADVLAVGSGLGKTEFSKNELTRCLLDSNKPLLLDADALNLIAADDRLLQLMKAYVNGEMSGAPAGVLWNEVSDEDAKIVERDIVLTPHGVELDRLYEGCVRSGVLDSDEEVLIAEGEQLDEEEKSRLKKALSIASALRVTVVAKGARSFVVVPGKTEIFMNDRGNCGMATAGSGDVLTGVIVGLMAQGLGGAQSAERGVQLHALSGDWVAEKRGIHALMAGDLIEALGQEA